MQWTGVPAPDAPRHVPGSRSAPRGPAPASGEAPWKAAAGAQRTRGWTRRHLPRGRGAGSPGQAGPAGPRQRAGCASGEDAAASATLRGPRALGPGSLPSTNGRLRSPPRRGTQPCQQLRRLSGSCPTSWPAEALRRAHPPRPRLTRSSQPPAPHRTSAAPSTPVPRATPPSNPGALRAENVSPGTRPALSPKVSPDEIRRSLDAGSAVPGVQQAAWPGPRAREDPRWGERGRPGPQSPRPAPEEPPRPGSRNPRFRSPSMEMTCSRIWFCNAKSSMRSIRS